MKNSRNETSHEEVKRMPIYLVVNFETIVNSDGNVRFLSQSLLGVFETEGEAHEGCRDLFYYANYLCDERKKEDEDFYFETNGNELTITTNLFQLRGLLSEGDPETILVSKFEVIEVVK